MAAVLLAFALPATAAKSTYDLKFVNHTSVAIAYYKAVDGVWVYQFTVYPGFTNILRDAPKKQGGRDIWAADLGPNGNLDLARNDFGTHNWRWFVGENIPR